MKGILIGIGCIVFAFGTVALIAVASQLIDEYKHRKED